VIARALARNVETRDGLPMGHRGWRNLLMLGPATIAGPAVNEQSSLGHSTVYACVRFLANTLGAMPLQLMERTEDGRGRRVARQHPSYELFARRPNERQTKFQAIQFLAMSYFLRGNAIAMKQSRPDGTALAYYPLRWDHISPQLVDDQMVYLWQPTRAPDRPFLRDQVTHITGLSTDGVLGLSPIAVQREAIGHGLAMQEYGARFFTNAATPSGILKHPGKLGGDDEERRAAIDRLRTQWEQTHGQLEHAHRVAIFEEGMEFEQVGMAPRDAEYLEGRKFNRTDVAGWFGVPLHLIGDHERGDFSIDTLSREFVYYHLQPHLVNFESQLARDLLTPSERETLYLRFNPNALLRGKPDERAAYYNQGIMGGWLIRNEARDREELEPKEGLDAPLVPLNMASIDPKTGITTTIQLGAAGTPGGIPTPPAASPPAQRTARDADARARLAATFVPTVEDLVGRLLRAELRELEKLVTAHFGPPDEIERSTPAMDVFMDGAERFHDPDASFRRFMLQQIRPVTESLGTAVFDLAEHQVGRTADRAGFALFLDELARTFAARYAVASLSSLGAAVNAAPEAPAAAARAAFGIWRDERPARVAHKETVFESRAATKEAYRRSGYTRLRWRSRGETCPFCKGMDGKVVAIEGGSFASADEEIVYEGRKPLKPRSNITHPPLHRGCDCEIEPDG
jgi:HK97 family phage portal protein